MPTDTQTDTVSELLSKWNLMDVVGYILAKSGYDRFTSDRYKLQTAFRQLKEGATETESELLSELIFATREIFPYCRDLERALMYLQLGGLLMADNPELVSFTVSRKLRDYVIREAEHIFSVEQQFDLNNLTAKFRQYLPPKNIE